MQLKSFLLLTELISCLKSTLLQTYTRTEATETGVILKPEAHFYCWTMPLKMGSKWKYWHQTWRPWILCFSVWKKNLFPNLDWGLRAASLYFSSVNVVQKLYKHRSKSAIAITKINEKSISSSETGMQIKELSGHILPKNKLTITILKTVCGLTHIFWQDALSPTTARFIQKQWHWRVSVSPVKLEERCSADHHESMDRIHSTTAAVLDKCSLTIEANTSKMFCKRITLNVNAFKNERKRKHI